MYPGRTVCCHPRLTHPPAPPPPPPGVRAVPCRHHPLQRARAVPVPGLLRPPRHLVPGHLQRLPAHGPAGLGARHGRPLGRHGRAAAGRAAAALRAQRVGQVGGRAGGGGFCLALRICGGARRGCRYGGAQLHLEVSSVEVAGGCSWSPLVMPVDSLPLYPPPHLALHLLIQSTAAPHPNTPPPHPIPPPPPGLSRAGSW